MHFTLTFPTLEQLKQGYFHSNITYHRALQVRDMDQVAMRSRDGDTWHFQVEDRFEDYEVSVSVRNQELSHHCPCASRLTCCHHAAAAILLLEALLRREREQTLVAEGEPYSREEMIERVLRERVERAEKEDYSLTIADNIYGIHQLKSASGRTYALTIRDFDRGSGYCSCPDFRTNKLGTCKHLIYAQKHIMRGYPVRKLTETQPYPFVEIYCDPHKDYQITYFYKDRLSLSIAALLEKHFRGQKYILPEQYYTFLHFLEAAASLKKIVIRPEVFERVENYFENEAMLKLSETVRPNFSRLKTKLLPFQEEGVRFSLFKKGAIIADDMGLGKTIQAIASAILKKDIYGLRRTLVICPASLKSQWQQEIKRCCGETVAIVEGGFRKRQALYRESDAFFLIANYEAVVRDVAILMAHPPDMIILDEAQRIKNYTTKTSYAVKAIPKKHALVITGTPIENRLGDLYSIMNFIDPKILAPLWEFSMNHCYFDKSKKNIITRYFNIQALRERLAPWLIRREKSEVIDQLPERHEITVPVNLHPRQAEQHDGMARSLAPILARKHKTVYDMQRIHQILMRMRMVCNSTFLLELESNISPKLDELEEILLDKLDIQNRDKKVIIFSEFKTMLRLIDKMLSANNIESVTLTGDVAVKNRRKVIGRFRDNAACRVLLASEIAGTGLNLQFADTLINFELPWNPARKNQRIGRIHRLGQKSSKITIVNLVAQNSIEERIQDGIILKESLFDAVLKEGSITDEVDFSKKGRASFIEQVEQLVRPFDVPQAEEYRENLDKLSERTALDISLAESIDDPAETDLIPTHANAVPGPGEQVAPETEGKPSPETEVLTNTLNQGLQFLSSLMQMSTGEPLKAEGQSISIDPTTGEVIMKFKLPYIAGDVPDKSTNRNSK